LNHRSSGGAARWTHAVLGVVVLCGYGCASAPSVRYDELARDLGLRRELIDGEGYLHAVYTRGGAAGGEPLHIYLESDGSPWIGETRVAEDPTPAEPVALQLLHADPSPAALIGRPCYHGLQHTTGCEPRLWTDARYSEEIVASMAAAVKRVADRYRARHLVLIGYSGGGALAMLLAERVANVNAVVTIAGNLDTEAWTRLHAYSPLSGSLNPARRGPLPSRIAQLHLAGGRDKNVPVALIGPVVRRQPHAELRVYDDADHGCCWGREWPRVLEDIAGQRPLEPTDTH
jgi:pimeloyl-ACP methyl ester carboxylesterase